MKLEELVAEASKLPEEQRADLASRLIQGLSASELHVPDDEVLMRMREAGEDPGVMISYGELLSGHGRRHPGVGVRRFR